MTWPGTRTAGALVVLALVLVGCSSPSESPPSTPSADAERDGPVGPREEVRGVPRGWRHDEVGARAAAVAYVGLSGKVVLAGFVTRRDLITAMATPEFAAELEAETTEQLAAMSDDLTEAGVSLTEGVWTEIPLTAHVTSADAGAAEVEVWSVTIVGLPEVDAVPRQSWRTVTVGLEWVEGDWRVSGWDATSGPTPALGPAPSIDTVEDLAEVTGWPMTWEAVG